MLAGEDSDGLGATDRLFRGPGPAPPADDRNPAPRPEIWELTLWPLRLLVGLERPPVCCKQDCGRDHHSLDSATFKLEYSAREFLRD